MLSRKLHFFEVRKQPAATHHYRLDLQRSTSGRLREDQLPLTAKGSELTE